MTASIDSPRLAPKSGTAKQLVVLLHGLGADGNDLIELGEQWRDWLPDATFVAPHAPDPCSNVPMGREWFPLSLTDPREFWRGVTYAAPQLDAFLDRELTRHSLPASKLALVGFSQGAMMAFHVGLRRQTAPAAIVGYSGLLVLEDGQGPESLKETRSKPPILLVHGDRDDVVPVEMFFFRKKALSAAEIPFQWHLSIGLGHGIDEEGLRQGGLFLAQAFGLPCRGAI
ncbi:alpha/beta hydrolase [Microvirga sp. VF16]|uniref:alpha/beta hydrolase n=1 Tax=Microvirga sp. VF16 TaxID=2807101 RepID=UPI00193EBCFD|nr:dienelactone hydrolase family protein [Microvirga sp. VF16]QRM28990.1 dienelactone hydrolase family protein [Microvirga sp. VF16]